MALKVFTRYLAREILVGTSIMVLALLGLQGFFDVLAEVRDVGRGGYDYGDALLFVALTLPGRSYDLMPICVLLGGLYALTVMARHSEITVLRASGLSTGTLLGTLLRIGLFFVLVTAAVGEWLAPASERLAQQIKLEAMGKMVGREFRTGLWVKDGRAFVNVRDVHPDGSLRNLRIYEFDDHFRLTSQRVAARGSYLDEGRWRLEQVVETKYADAGSRRSELAAYEWRSGLTPDVVSVLMVAPDRMSLSKLAQYVDYLDANRRVTDRYEMAFWKKLVYPFVCLVMLVLALPFAYLHDRLGGVSAKIFVGIMLGIAFYLLNGLFANFGAINKWSPPMAALIPSSLFLVLAAIMIWRVERR